MPFLRISPLTAVFPLVSVLSRSINDTWGKNSGIGENVQGQWNQGDRLSMAWVIVGLEVREGREEYSLATLISNPFVWWKA